MEYLVWVTQIRCRKYGRISELAVMGHIDKGFRVVYKLKNRKR